ncbi:MAG: 2OG-Fe(II) oxygenase family protein [Hyphomicrobiales bacterium]
MIPIIDVSSLFDGPSKARERADAAILEAAHDPGFITVTGLPDAVPSGPRTRASLLRLFALPEAEKRKLWRQKFDPARPNIYRGWFPLQDGHATYKEGIDMGPDVAHGQALVDDNDPLREATPVPDENVLPGWLTDVSAYYRGMELTCNRLMRSIARSLNLPETAFDDMFRSGISTLRLIRYPVRTAQSFGDGSNPELWTNHNGERRYVIGRPHVDSGFLTLIAQDGVDGLQARSTAGDWIDVPPLEGSFALNFGNTLESMTGGRLRATEHRVIGSSRERFSIPFFYEPRVDAVVSPLPLAGIKPFEPYLYGDHLWATTTRFVEFLGLEPLRPPRGVASGMAEAIAAELAVHGRVSSSSHVDAVTQDKDRPLSPRR